MSACLGCQILELPDCPVVTLADGSVVCSSCPAWRFECEVRHVRDLDSDLDRKAYLAGVAEARGTEAAAELRAAAWALMQAVA